MLDEASAPPASSPREDMFATGAMPMEEEARWGVVGLSICMEEFPSSAAPAPAAVPGLLSWA